MISWEIYRNAVNTRMANLNVGLPGTFLSEIGAKADVIAQLFPMLPFNAFQVIDEEAKHRHDNGLPPL